MGASNTVISGKYKGRYVSSFLDSVYIQISPYKLDHEFDIKLSRQNVSHYEILDSNERKSAVSAGLRAATGALVLGPIGLVAGLSAKTKGTYLIAITFKDNKQSLIEVDEKIKKLLLTELF